jgi:DNA-binding response OmpR family regulator
VGTILLVDDDEQLGAVLRANFRLGGHDVVDARGAEAALAALERRIPDAIVLAASPDDTDGAGTVRRIRDHRRGGDVPVIVLTASDLA